MTFRSRLISTTAAVIVAQRRIVDAITGPAMALNSMRILTMYAAGEILHDLGRTVRAAYWYRRKIGPWRAEIDALTRDVTA